MTSTALKIYEILTRAGISVVGAAAIIGNLEAESGLFSNNLENTANSSMNISDSDYTNKVNSGVISAYDFIHDKAGYGLAQWTYYTRKKGLYEMCKAAGKSIDDLETQTRYIITELSNDFPTVYTKLREGKYELRDLVDLVLRKYEAPADTGAAVLNYRYKLSKKWYDLFSAAAPLDGMTVTVTFNGRTYHGVLEVE